MCIPNAKPFLSGGLFKPSDINQSSGVTFFIVFNTTVGVHVHTPAAPSAQSTYLQLSNWYSMGIMWVYLPITTSDPITAFGVRVRKTEYQAGHPRPAYLVLSLCDLPSYE
jgi:hypothetical protein